MFYNDDEDDALRMRWALVCSVHDDSPSFLNTLSDFASWFLSEVSEAARKMNIYEKFEGREKMLKFPAVMLVLHILPEKDSPEHGWMRTLSSVHGFIRQGVLLDNALDRFAAVTKNVSDPYTVYRSFKPYDLRVGSGKDMPTNMKVDQDTVQTVVRTVLAGQRNPPLLHRSESAVLVSGFPSSLNEFGIAQLFHGLKVTAVSLGGDSAVVTFATKFLALQACALHSKQLDRLHTLRVEPLLLEVQEQLALTKLRKG
uniref:AAA_11 domain-containing protein n=1 Tax=Angiostrongylus cantonensis TaxID=6313 RepID=A0A0K0DLI9_ANGCA